MNHNVRVHSIQSLDQLRMEFKRFAGDTRDILQSIEAELNRMERYLHDQVNYWHNKEEMYKIEVSNAKRNLKDCLDENDDENHCSSEEECLTQANSHLRQAQIKLQDIKKKLETFKEVAREYQRKAKRLKMLIDGDLQRGDAVLNHTIKNLYEYSDL